MTEKYDFYMRSTGNCSAGNRSRLKGEINPSVRVRNYAIYKRVIVPLISRPSLRNYDLDLHQIIYCQVWSLAEGEDE